MMTGTFWARKGSDTISLFLNFVAFDDRAVGEIDVELFNDLFFLREIDESLVESRGGKVLNRR